MFGRKYGWRRNSDELKFSDLNLRLLIVMSRDPVSVFSVNVYPVPELKLDDVDVSNS